MRRAYSLVELLVVLSIVLILIAVSWPLFAEQIHNSRFRAFTSELTGTLVTARSVAQMTENPVHLDLAPDGMSRFHCTMLIGEREVFLVNSPWRGGYDNRIRNALPSEPLPHPTRSGDISKPLGSTHAPKLIFSSRGSSSGTVVFSDDEGRAVCVVVSGNTGRFRVFLWDRGAAAWRPFF